MKAERLRPNLVSTLVAVFRPKDDPNVKRDMMPFHETMKRIAETLFLTLFSTILLPQNLLRVWDVVFLYGFEAAHKVALTLLSKDERFFKNKVKAEVKNIGLGNSIDALLAGGNHARAKLFLKIEKVPIEKLIKKALTKLKYKSLKYEDFIASADRLERDYMTRINRLRQTRALLLQDNLLNNIEDTRYLFDTLRRFDHQGIISRQIFMQTVTKEFNWSKATALNVFTTFDQKGNESLDIREVLSGICILFNGPLDERLELLFKVFDINDSSYIEPDEAIDIISVLETSLDVRSNFFKVQSVELFERMDSNKDSKVTQEEFVKCLKEDPACKLIMDFLQGLESQDGTALSFDYINLAEQGSFIDIHSPLRRSISTTPLSDISEPNEIDDIVHKIDMISSSLKAGDLNRALSIENYMEVRPVIVESPGRNDHKILEMSEETDRDHTLGETPIAKLDIEENEHHGVEITTETVNGNIVLKLKIGDLLGLDEDLEEIASMKASSSDFGNLGDYIDIESSPVLIENYYQDDRMYDLRATTPTEIRAIFDDEKVNIDGITYEDPAFVQVEHYFSRQSSRIEPNSGQIPHKTKLSLSRRSSGKSSLDSDSVHSEKHSNKGRSNYGMMNHGQIPEENSQDFRKEDEALEKHLNKLRSMQVSQMPEDETEIDLANRVEISASEKSGGSNRICSRMCAKGGCVIF
jgi:Ca2+-binding EF-hand superfamily protein